MNRPCLYRRNTMLGFLRSIIAIKSLLFGAKMVHASPWDYPDKPLVSDSVVFEEVDGLVAIEAEHFSRQSMNQVRAWYINSPVHRPNAQPDYDDASFSDAGGLAYMEVLPDTFHTDNDPIIGGHNLGKEGGTVAVLHYRVHFNKPGTYYLWTRLRSNDEEDNTIQAGIDGTWPDTALILQSPVNKKAWIWKNENRISRTPWKIGRASLEVKTPGEHDVQFCMREDGEEFDRFVLALDPEFKLTEGVGPEPKLKSGALPKAFSLDQQRQPLARRLLNPDGSCYGANVVYDIVDGKLAIEAENFYRQSQAVSRMWHLTTSERQPSIGPDSDPPHIDGASDGAYLELLPDVRQKDEDKMHSKTSILAEGGKGAILSYMVGFPEPGKYYVWVRALAVDGDDNTLHVGLDNQWPESSKKLTFQSRKWGWSNTQRDTKAPIYVEVANKGVHELQISMREDGCELDRIFITDKPDFKPSDEETLPTKIRKGDMDQWLARRVQTMSTERVFVERDGMVTIEVESMPATDDWKYFADGNGHSGLGYLEWSGKGQGIKAGTGLLKADFQIETPGNYQLLIRGKMKDPKNRPDTLDPDGNDIWLKVEGGNNVDGQTELKNDWNKIAMLGHPESWTWNSHVDVDKSHPASPVCRRFEKGTYSLTLSGRSEGYAIDKLILIRYTDSPSAELDFKGEGWLQLPESEVIWK